MSSVARTGLVWSGLVWSGLVWSGCADDVPLAEPQSSSAALSAALTEEPAQPSEDWPSAQDPQLMSQIEALRTSTQDWTEVNSVEFAEYQSLRRALAATEGPPPSWTLDGPAGESPTPMQQAALDALDAASPSSLHIEWWRTTGLGLSHIGGLDFVADAVEPSAALGSFFAQYESALRSVLAMSPSESWQLDDVQPTDGGDGWMATLHHFVGDTRVSGDWLRLTLSPHTAIEGTHWIRAADLQYRPVPETVVAQALAPATLGLDSLALEQVGAGAEILRSARHLVADSEGSLRLVRDLILLQAKTPWLVRMDEPTGEILHVGAQVAGSTSLGDLTIKVRPPYTNVGDTPVDGALTHAHIIEDPGFSPILGTTEDDGSYTIVHSSSQSDWFVQFVGTWLEDVNATPASYLAEFPHNQSYAFSALTDAEENRRGEFYYLGNYLRELSSQVDGSFAFLGAPIEFQYETVTFDDYCFGFFDYVPGDPRIRIGTKSGTSCEGLSATVREQYLRWVFAHEFAHWLDFSSASSADPCPTGEAFCRASQEGWADALGYIANRHEYLRRDDLLDQCTGTGRDESFYPDLTYPADYLASCPYVGANIFSGTYLEFAHLVGWRSGLQRIFGLLPARDESWSWRDHLTDWLAADAALLSSSPYRYELSRAQILHDDGGTLYWADDYSSRNMTPHYLDIRKDWNEVKTSTDDLSNEANAILRLNTVSDEDWWSFYAVAGETYEIQTYDLESSLDTYLQILGPGTSADPVVAYNDNCNGSTLASCISWTASASGLYKIRVHSVMAASRGYYEIRVRMSSDDHADTYAPGVDGLPLDGSVVDASLGASDFDWFRITAPPSASTLTLSACGVADDGITLELYDSSGTFIDKDDDAPGDTCAGAGGAILSYAFSAAATYYVAISGHNVGAVEVTATVSGGRDLSDSRIDAWTLVPGSEAVHVTTDLSDEDREDWYKIEMSQGGIFAAETFDLLNGEGTFIEVYDDETNGYGDIPDSTLRWMSRDFDGAVEDEGSRVQFAAPRSGTYYIRVRNEDAVATPYTLVVSTSSSVNPSMPEFP